MKILITPEDIVKRCLWDSYIYYVAKCNDKEAERILIENQEFELSERDAIVIGLLKVIETDNLIHRFNDYLTHFLNIRSLKDKDKYLIRKKSIENSISLFLDKFPDYWTPPVNYSNALKDLIIYIDDIKEKINEIDIVNLTIQNVEYEFYNSASIKKLLNFNNY